MDEHWQMKWLLIFLALAGPVQAECVVLLHGLARGTGSMDRLARVLRAEGYAVVNQGYPSRHATVEALAAEAIPAAVKACPVPGKRHFVTHSMGGILVRAYFRDAQPDWLGRVVMLAPPNQGSEIVDGLGGLAPFGWINGPAGRQLATDGLPGRLGPARFEVGVIAGTRSISPIYSAMIEGRDDGKVSIASTRLEGMADHVMVPATHTFIASHRGAMQQVVAFLKAGRFLRDGQ